MRARFAAGIAIAALIAWSVIQRWQLLTASPFPLGVDGYFYPVELRGVLDHGGLAYPASPLAFYLLAPFAAITDPITGAKLGAAVYGALIAAPMYGVAARLGGGRGAGLLAAALATTSLGSLYLTVEFVKNSLGLTVALTALWLILRATERPSAARIVGAALGVIAAYATHKMAAALVVVVAVPAVLSAGAAHGALRGRRLLIAIGGVVGAAIVAIALGAAAPERFLSAGDLALGHDLLAATPRWTAPALARPGGDLQLGYDALVGGVLAAIAIGWALAGRRPRVPGAGWPIVALALVIGVPFLAVADRQGLGFRLRAAAFVPTALAAALVARAVLGTYVHRARVLVALAVVLGLGRAIAAPRDAIDGEIVTHPALVTAAEALASRVPAGAVLVVPERHIAFMLAWYTGAPVAIDPSRVPPPLRYRVLPLHFIGQGSALDRALIAARAEPGIAPPIGAHPSHANGLVLVAEPTWRWLLDHVPPGDRARLAAWPTI